YITTANPKNFQPMNINFGLFPPLEVAIKNRRERNLALAERALASLEVFSKNLEI
ncbi:MAG: methylenetetrahydrofolate--tRNA-(uracil(54)-C(5))-methyltransferase (FADH(2)-oxidizing) TrmFO, partial [bacterium]